MRQAWRLGLCALAIGMFVGCQGAETVGQGTVPKETPTPQPVTSLGRLTRAETSSKVKVTVQYLTINGLKSGVDDKEAGVGKVFVVLHFEGRKETPKKKESGLVMLSSGSDGGRLQTTDNSGTGEPDLWLTDKENARYSEWSSFWEKENGSIAFEVPSGATGFVFHDGKDHAYSIKPVPAPAPPPSPSSSSSPAGGAK